jgi:hypothetical protein
MRTSIATVSLSGSLGEKLEAIAAAKFDAVEIFENDLVTFNGTPSRPPRCKGLQPRHLTLHRSATSKGTNARVFARPSANSMS